MDEMRRSAMASGRAAACRQSAREMESYDDAALAPRSSSGKGKHGAPGLLRWLRRILRVDK